MRPRVRPLALIAAAASALAFLATVYWVQRWNVVTITLLVLMAWAAAVSAIDALTIGVAPAVASAGAPPRAEQRAPVTFVVRLGEERVDIARTSITLASRSGPVVVVATRHHELLDDLGDVEVSEYVAPTIVEALNDAARVIATDAVLVFSASAFPLGDACEVAAAQLTDRVGWVVGAAPAFNNDRYAPGERELLDVRVRAAARGLGLVTWEPDATIVRTSLLREHPLGAGRPYGSWLRARAAEGWRGGVLPEPVAVRAAPADAPVFWPTQTNRRRGAVADFADATTSGAALARMAALGGLLRGLYAYSIALWLLAIVLVGRSGVFPLSVSAVKFFALVGGLAGLRWIASRLAHGIGLHPFDEAREAAYDVPGSLLALPSALMRCVRPVRLAIPDQPLLWGALIVTLVTTVPLLDRRSSTGGAVGIAVGLVLGAIAATWVFALRALGARRWDRASYRLPVDFPATIDGIPVRTIDASPSGLAVIGHSPMPERGSQVIVTVAFDESGNTALLRGRVTDLRRIGPRTAVGLALDLDAGERARWVRQLFAAAGVTHRAPVVPVTSGARSGLSFDHEPISARRRLATGLQIGAVGAVSALVIGALLLTLFGFRPMVVRSGSMVPTLRVGDVVVASWVHADQIHAGEIVSYPAELAASSFDVAQLQLITHRVQHVSLRGNTVRVVTKGDANTDSEQWSAGRDVLVGHVLWTIPKVGVVLVALGNGTTRGLLVGASAALVLVALLDARRRGRKAVTVSRRLVSRP